MTDGRAIREERRSSPPAPRHLRRGRDTRRLMRLRSTWGSIRGLIADEEARDLEKSQARRFSETSRSSRHSVVFRIAPDRGE